MIIAPDGLKELNRARFQLASVRVRDEKSATAIDELDLQSFLDSTKFSKPFTFSATRGAAASSAADAAIVSFAFTCSLLPSFP